MALISEFLNQVFWLVKESAPYMLLGLLIAGFLRYSISEKRFIKAFGKNNFKSVGLAALFGIPLPLCSCSVLPMMLSLRKQGASKGATTSFLVSTPETGVDSISITYALLDPVFTVVRPLAALISALVTGSVVNLFVKKGWDEKQEKPADGEIEEPNSCKHACQVQEQGSLLKRAVSYGFGNLMDDLTPLLILAFAASGLISVLIPDGFFDHPVTQGWPGMFLMLLVGIPLYVCATSSTPLVAALMLKGLSPGAALVFLLAGPVTNLGTLLAVMKAMGVRIMAIYLFSTALVALLMGGIIETIYSDLAIPVKTIVGTATGFMPEAVKVGSLVLLLGMMTRSMIRTRLLHRWGTKVQSLLRPMGIDPLGRSFRMVFLVLLILIYLSSAFTVVQVGEAGWVFTFGEVERDEQGEVVTRKPGLHLHLPYPFQVLSARPANDIRSLAFGYRPESEVMEMTELAAEAQVMDGEEGLVSLKFSVLYTLSDPYRFYYGTNDPEDLIRNCAASAVRCVCAVHATQYLLVGNRRALEQATAKNLQAEMDDLDSGVEIVGVVFVDLHAPAEVHFAFRDVASSAENKHQQELKGESTYLATLAEARGQAIRINERAASDRHGRVSLAQGKSRAFTERAASYRETEEITRIRLYLDTMGRALAGTPVVFPLASDIDVELWFDHEGARQLPMLNNRTGEQDNSPGDEEKSIKAPATDAMGKVWDPNWYKTIKKQQDESNRSDGRLP